MHMFILHVYPRTDAMITKKRVLVLAVVLTAVVSSSTLAQNDFEDCDLIGSPDFQLLLGAGGQMLFRDEDLVNDNECETIPANDYELYVDGVVQAPNFFHYQLHDRELPLPHLVIDLCSL